MLVVCSFIPYPAFRGDPVRVLGLIKVLEENAKVELWCVQSDFGDVEGLVDEVPASSVVVFPRTRLRQLGVVSDVIRFGQAVVSGVPSWILKRESEVLRRSLQRRHGEFDTIIVCGEASAMLFSDLEGRWHWDKFNVLTFSTELALQEARGLVDNIKARINRSAARRFERRMAAKASSASVTNVEEGVRFESVFGYQAIVVPSSVPVPEYRRDPIERRLVWLGNFSYESNFEGLRRFLEEVWPSLATGRELRLIGSELSDDQASYLEGMPGVSVVGYVEDLQFELSRASVGVVPLWSGGGTKMKTLTMMAHGLPVVSTSVGAEGIAESAGLYVCSSAFQMAELICHVEGDPDREQRGRRGRENVRLNYSEGAIESAVRLVLAAPS